VLADQFRAGRSGDGDLSANVPLSFSLRGDALLVHVNLGAMRPAGARRGSASWGRRLARGAAEQVVTVGLVLQSN
jgi:hypothetical protein